MLESPLIRWLLDVDLIPKGAEHVRLGWERPLHAWVWVLIVLAIGLFAAWSYSRMIGGPRKRFALAALRALALLLVAILLCGPTLELPRETIEQDWVLMLVDRSASMTIADASTEENSASTTERMTREQKLESMLEDNAATFKTLGESRHVVWLGFNRGAFELPAAGDQPLDGDVENEARSTLPVLGEADGKQSNLYTALDQAIQRAAARPLSGVVIFSDGRSTDARNSAIVRRLQADAVPVFVAPLGSPNPVGDLAVRRVDSPRAAFIRDRVPVVVEIDRLGAAFEQGSDIQNGPATLKLIDRTTGEVLNTLDIDPRAEIDRYTLTAEPGLAGETTWEVVLETTTRDLIPDNNSKAVMISLIDRPLRVLYIDGYPRWEYRFLKDLLVLEKTMQSSVILMSADRDFAQEGNVPITRIPRSADEFAQYDVIILGDVASGSLSPEQRQLIRNHIAERGAGLLWIAGERFTPESYGGTVLADLLPMRGSLALQPIDEPVNIAPTPLAERLGVLQLVSGSGAGWPIELSDPSFGWSQLQYAQRIEQGRLKPTAEVLAETTTPFAGSTLPLVMTMRFGAGQAIYVATDEIWRWRYGRGDRFPEQFWVQMIRMLGRESLAGGGAQATLDVSPRRIAVRQPLRIEVRLLDSQLVDAQRTSIRAVLETLDGRELAELELKRVDGSENLFAATYLPEATGQLRVRIDDAAMQSLMLQSPVEVYQPDDELRRPEADHDLLANLAAETGGAVLDASNLHTLNDPRVMRNRAVRTMTPLVEPIWDTPLAFCLVLLLLTAEWVGRKLIRLI
jgi:hypothetical protein